MMTKSASSCRSLYQLQDGRATGVLLMLLLSVVRVDAAYRGVATRDHGVSFYCEVYFVGVSPRVKVWVGTYCTEALAALACDVAFYYTNRPSKEFNLENSEDAIIRNCKPRSAYDSLNGWNERRTFIRAEANALINLMSSEDHAQDFRWADVTVPPLVPVCQRTGDIACTLVEHFRNQAERLREFMAWLMRLSNAATQSTLTGHVQTFLQQQREETISQLDIEEALPVGGDQFLDAARVRFLLEAVEARPGGALWLTLIATSLPLLLQLFTKRNARDIKGATINANDPAFTEQERCESRAECSTKRQKVKHPSIELAPYREDLFTATHFDVKDEARQCTGYDMRSKTSRTLPLYSFLPDADLFKEYLICGHDSLTCVNISDMGAELVVFNPWTGKKIPLPPLLFPKHPVLLHMSVDSATNSYRVIVSGSSSSGEEHLTKKMEVFDSKTSKRKEMCDLPGSAFGLKKYQAGVCTNGILYFISFLEGDGGKGVVAFDVENGKWLPIMTCLISSSSSLTVIQLVENNGELYLFYEQVGKPCNTHCIDVLEISNSASEEVSCHLRNVVQVKVSGRRLEVYLEYTCVEFGEHKLCIFNTIEPGAVVYDVRSRKVSEALKFLAGDGGKVVVAFDAENGKWLPIMTCLISSSSSLTVIQLVENNGVLNLFYQQVGKPYNTHCIDVLEISNSASEEVIWNLRNVVRLKGSGRGLEVYPEYTCVEFGEHKLCIFNTIELDGVVYDVRSGKVSEALESLRDQISVFHSLNPLGFKHQPSVKL